MKIYFSGSVRGGRADAEQYYRIISYIQKTDTVLTEHIGALELQESVSDKYIYARDTTWLKMSDMIIAECSSPSLGVGYELAYAEKYNKPVHIFFRKERKLSAMLAGNPYFVIHPYSDEREIYNILNKVLGR